MANLKVYLVTELCDADLHTVINSDTPLSHLSQICYTKRCALAAAVCTLESFLVDAGFLQFEAKIMCNFSHITFSERYCNLGIRRVMPRTLKKWHPTFWPLKRRQIQWCAEQRSQSPSVTLIPCKQMQWGICTLRMLCTGIWSRWMFWPLGFALYSATSVWTLAKFHCELKEAPGLLCFETTKVMKNCDIKQLGPPKCPSPCRCPCPG